MIPIKHSLCNNIILSVYQTLTLKTFLYLRAKVLAPHALLPPEQQVEEARSYQIPIGDVVHDSDG